MNIGFFTDTYRPQINGVILSIELFRKELEKRGHNVYIFAPSFKNGDAAGAGDGVISANSANGFGISPHLWGRSVVDKEDDHVFRFRSMTSIFMKEYPLAIPISFRTTVELSKLKLDIVHSHDPFALGMFADLVAYSKNIPLVHTYHTLYPDYIHYVFKKNYTIPKKLTARLSAAYCNRCDHIITPSQKLRTLLEEYGVTQPMSVLPTGIDLHSFEQVTRGEFRKAYRVPSHKKIISFVGRVGKEKNIEFLIRMHKVLLQTYPDCVLAIIGDGTDKDRLMQIARDEGIAQDVLFVGYLQREKVLEAYADSDAFVFSSLTDTQGMVLLEAAASAKPIVMIEDSGLTDIVEDGINGFMTANDTHAFAQRVAEILRDDALAARLGVASVRVVRQYSIEQQTDELEKLYTEVIAAHTSANWREKFWRELNREIPLENFRKFPLTLTKLLRDIDKDNDRTDRGE